MKAWLILVLVRISLAVPAVIVAVEVMAIIGWDRDHFLWVGIIGATAAIAAGFASNVISIFSKHQAEQK